MHNEQLNNAKDQQDENVSIDLLQFERVMQKKRDRQNLLLGIAAGLGASIIGAMIWAGITVATEYQIGWMAVGIGFLVGYAVRFAGKGFDRVYGIIGAVFSLCGCILGNLFTVFWYIVTENKIPVIDVLSIIDLTIISQVMIETFQFMDILFYGIAIYEGYRFSINTVPEHELAQSTR